jgi:glycosyltransferase involved in cell wall biosynthesis
MRAATILVHPPISPDAMPTVIKEAMAVGTPVIASDLAGIPEMLDQGRCGVLVPPGDRAALAQAIAALLEDPDRRRHYAEAGRRHTERRFDQRINGATLARRLATTVRREQLHDCA